MAAWSCRFPQSNYFEPEACFTLDQPSQAGPLLSWRPNASGTPRLSASFPRKSFNLIKDFKTKDRDHQIHKTCCDCQKRQRYKSRRLQRRRKYYKLLKFKYIFCSLELIVVKEYSCHVSWGFSCISDCTEPQSLMLAAFRLYFASMLGNSIDFDNICSLLWTAKDHLTNVRHRLPSRTTSISPNSRHLRILRRRKDGVSAILD